MVAYSDKDRVWIEEILKERFSQNLDLSLNDCSFKLAIDGQVGNIEFKNNLDIFKKNNSSFPCTHWFAEREGFVSALRTSIPMPGLERPPSPVVEKTESGYAICYDIIGLTYWMLSRLEEVDRKDLDLHGRFPASSSHALKNNYLERPIVDEWLDILGQVMNRQWPQLQFTQNHFSTRVSHDVDVPARFSFHSPTQIARLIAGDLVKRMDPKSAAKAANVWLRSSKYRIHPSDPANTFRWLMDRSDENGLKSAFFFICGRTNKHKDGNYEIEDARIRLLLKEINGRGHEIGLHPSYNTYKDPKAFLKEVTRLRKVCSEEGIQQNVWGGRMHYLRWDHPSTLHLWDNAGMDYDATLGYADRPGFRCGTCFEYPAYDPVSQEKLSVRIRPLISMECTVIAKKYLGLGSTEAAYEKFSDLKEKCRLVNGQFSLLWHNSNFVCESDFEIYHRLIVS